MPHQLLFQILTVTFGSALVAWLGVKIFQDSPGCGFRMIWTILGAMFTFIASDNALAAFGMLMAWTLVCSSLAHDFNEVNIAEGGYGKRNLAIGIRLAVVLLGLPGIVLAIKWSTWLFTYVFYGQPTVLTAQFTTAQVTWLLFMAWSFVIGQFVAYFTAVESPFSAVRFREQFPELAYGRPRYCEDEAPAPPLPSRPGF